MSEITNRGRKLRKNLTSAERLLWNELRDKKLGVKFRRQYPLVYFDKDIRHCFIADFICLDSKIVIEIDGEIHKHRVAYDLERSYIINQLCFDVIRFTNKEVNMNMREVLADIEKHIKKSSLPHAGGEGLGMGA